MTLLKISDFFRMLVQRCALEQHRLILPVSVTKPVFSGQQFQPSLSHNSHRALVDTGAQRTVLSRSLIQQQNLVRIGHMQFAGLHGPQTHSRYLANIGFWVRRVDGQQRPAEFEQAELSLFNLDPPFEVVDMQDNVNFDLILGFDVLKLMSFSFNTGLQTFEIVVADR